MQSHNIYQNVNEVNSLIDPMLRYFKFSSLTQKSAHFMTKYKCNKNYEFAINQHHLTCIS